MAVKGFAQTSLLNILESNWFLLPLIWVSYSARLPFSFLSFPCDVMVSFAGAVALLLTCSQWLTVWDDHAQISFLFAKKIPELRNGVFIWQNDLYFHYRKTCQVRSWVHAGLLKKNLFSLSICALSRNGTGKSLCACVCLCVCECVNTEGVPIKAILSQHWACAFKD